MSAQALNFANKIGPDVVTSCVNTGVFPSVVIAQAIEESAAGTSKMAIGANNFFGHMASGSWLGRVYRSVKGGKLWRAYNSAIECIKAHIEILKRPKFRLTGSFKTTTPQDQALALQKGGYNTGPDREQYARKLIAIIKAYNLQTYDSQMFAIERKANDNNLAYSEQSALTRTLHNLIG